MNGVVYCITNAVNGKQYVGITTQPLEHRFRFHLRGNGGCRRLSSAIKKHGTASFSVVEIDCADHEIELSRKEVWWIGQLGTLHPTGYNLSSGGASNMVVHQETRARQSVSAKARFESPAERAKSANRMKLEWADNPGAFATWSAKARTKRADLFSTPEWRAMKSASAKATNARTDVRAKLAEASRASWKGQAYRNAALAGLRNPATVAKRIATMRTPEARAQQSELTKAAMARPDVRLKLIAAAKRQTGKKRGPYKINAEKRNEHAHT